MSPRRRGQEHPDSGDAAPGAEPREGTGTPEEFELPENVEYFTRDELHGKAVLTLKDRTGQMLDEAIADPDSEANQLVRILLLNQVANMQPQSYQNDPRLTLTEERHRGAEFARRAELDKHTVALLKKRATKLEQDIKLSQTRTKELEHKIQAQEHQMAEAERLAQNAQAAAEHGAPLDPVSVYTRIAEIVGLQSPAEQSGASGQADG